MSSGYPLSTLLEDMQVREEGEGKKRVEWSLEENIIISTFWLFCFFVFTRYVVKDAPRTPCNEAVRHADRRTFRPFRSVSGLT